MARPSVLAPSSSIHSNSWNWNTQQFFLSLSCNTFWSQAWRLNCFGRLLTWCFRRNISWRCLLLFVHLFMQRNLFNRWKIQSAFRTKSPLYYVLSSRAAVVLGYALWKILQRGSKFFQLELKSQILNQGKVVCIYISLNPL